MRYSRRSYGRRRIARGGFRGRRGPLRRRIGYRM